MKPWGRIVGVCFLIGCVHRPDLTTLYYEVPDRIPEEAKPVYLAQKLLQEGKFSSMASVMSERTAQPFLAALEKHPEVFEQEQKHTLQSETGPDDFDYYTLEQFRKEKGAAAEGILGLPEGEIPRDVIVIIQYREEKTESGQHTTISVSQVTKEGDLWKLVLDLSHLRAE